VSRRRRSVVRRALDAAPCDRVSANTSPDDKAFRFIEASVRKPPYAADSLAACAYGSGGAVWLMGLTVAGMAAGDFQFADLPGLLRHRHGATLRALLLVAPEEDQPD